MALPGTFFTFAKAWSQSGFFKPLETSALLKLLQDSVLKLLSEAQESAKVEKRT